MKNPLTKREIEILILFSKGYTNGMVADSLNLSIHTIEAHRANIYNKLGVKNACTMISETFRKGILT